MFAQGLPSQPNQQFQQQQQAVYNPINFTSQHGAPEPPAPSPLATVDGVRLWIIRFLVYNSYTVQEARDFALQTPWNGERFYEQTPAYWEARGALGRLVHNKIKHSRYHYTHTAWYFIKLVADLGVLLPGLFYQSGKLALIAWAPTALFFLLYWWCKTDTFLAYPTKGPSKWDRLKVRQETDPSSWVFWPKTP